LFLIFAKIIIVQIEGVQSFFNGGSCLRFPLAFMVAVFPPVGKLAVTGPFLPL